MLETNICSALGFIGRKGADDERGAMATEPGLAYQNGAMPPAESSRPYYRPVGNEETVFKAAYRQGLSLVLKGPTGCGKTRFVEAMAHDLGRELITVACHDDLTTADLVGRYLLKSDKTVWVDGPLTRAVREGAICYLDEVVEARQDTTVVLHPLADYRRQLPIERLGITLDAAPEFGLVVSYNPGYQSVLKDLKDSTRQRMVAIEFGFPTADVEEAIVVHEAGVDHARAAELVRFGQAVRRLETGGLREVASTRVLIAAAQLITEGLSMRDAARAAIAGPLTDDVSVARGLNEMIDVYLGQPAGPDH
jgi:nitric oxide reductase NorQ protein